MPLPEARSDPEERAMLQQWLASYKPRELFNEDGTPNAAILSLVPETPLKRLGQRKEAYAAYTPLNVPEWRQFTVEKGTLQSCMKVVGEFLAGVVDEYVIYLCRDVRVLMSHNRRNPSTFRIFSPDELVSNKLDAVLRHSGRNFQWDVASRGNGGRVVEILSEHTCQGMLQGYTLTGRTGLFPSYEAFLGIVHTMMVQYMKFVKTAQETPWRQPVGSLNYVETSTWTRQEHNGFSVSFPLLLMIGCEIDEIFHLNSIRTRRSSARC